MTIIAIANQKGGVAKTTSTCVVASALKHKGYKVLAIDIDPQSSLSGNLQLDDPTRKSICDVLKQEATLNEVICHDKRFDIVPSNIMLATLESGLNGVMGREYRLRTAIEQEKLDYDFVLIDCPPAFGNMTVNALVACDYVIIPFEGAKNALVGIQALCSTISDVRRYFNPALKVAGLLQTRDNPRLKISQASRDVAKNIAEAVGCKLFETRIRNAVAASEADFFFLDLLEYAPDSTVAADYIAFTDELLKEVGEK